MGNIFFSFNVCQWHPRLTRAIQSRSASTSSTATSATLPSMCLEICDFWNSAAVYEKLNLLLCFRGDKTFAVWERHGDSDRGAYRGDDGLGEKMGGRELWGQDLFLAMHRWEHFCSLLSAQMKKKQTKQNFEDQHRRCTIQGQICLWISLIWFHKGDNRSQFLVPLFANTFSFNQAVSFWQVELPQKD